MKIVTFDCGDYYFSLSVIGPSLTILSVVEVFIETFSPPTSTDFVMSELSGSVTMGFSITDLK